MMKKTILSIIPILLLVFYACDREPVRPPEPVLDRMTIAELRAMYTGSTTLIDTNVYIGGIVTMTPEMKNIPDFIAYLQDETGAIALTVTGTNTLSMGSEIKVLVKGSSLTVYRGLMQFGNIDIAASVEVVTLAGVMPTPRKVTLAEIAEGKYEAEYVAIDTVEFSETGSLSGSKILTDCSSSGIVYTRSDALFSADAIPSGNGTFKGIVSIFDTPQLLIREPAELSMTGAKKCTVQKFEWLKEGFESLAAFQTIDNLSGWKAIAQAGTKKWSEGYYSSDGKYASCTAYNTGMASVISWMITPPLDLTGSTLPILTFRTKGGYDNGATLQTFISTDYDGGATPWNFTWTLLPATYPSVPTGGYGSWGNSGEINLSAYKTTVYIAWKYTGSAPSQTTTWQVDDIRVGEK